MCISMHDAYICMYIYIYIYVCACVQGGPESKKKCIGAALLGFRV